MGQLKKLKKKTPPQLTNEQVWSWFFGKEWRKQPMSTIVADANEKAGEVVLRGEMHISEWNLALHNWLINSGKYKEALK